MKNHLTMTLALVLTALIFLSGCGPKYTYKVNLVSPKPFEANWFKDKNVSIKFTPTAETVEMELFNLTEKTLVIAWSRAIFIDPEGKRHKVVHGEPRAEDIGKIQRPTRIGPKGSFSDTVHPADYFKLVGEPPYQEMNRKMILSGPASGTIQLNLPLEGPGISEYYKFKFSVQAQEATR